MRRLLPLLAAIAFVTVACGSDEDPTVDVPTGATSTPSTTSGASTTSTTEVTTGTDASFGDSATLPSDGYGHLTAVRHAQQEGFYRVVFEFRDATPGVKVEKASRPIVQDGSGDEIDVAGDEVVLVTFEPSSSYDMEADQASYDGPRRLEVELEPVVEIVRVSDFEAVHSWALGVDEGTQFRVTALDSPPRVVIDLR